MILPLTIILLLFVIAPTLRLPSAIVNVAVEATVSELESLTSPSVLTLPLNEIEFAVIPSLAIRLIQVIEPEPLTAPPQVKMLCSIVTVLLKSKSPAALNAADDLEETAPVALSRPPEYI